MNERSRFNMLTAEGFPETVPFMRSDHVFWSQ